MQRLDVLLAQLGLAGSRSRAATVIKSGNVKIDGQTVTKPSALFTGEEDIEVTPDHPYVSRGGLKLQGALQTFSVEVAGKTAADIGASTGGFTQCLLRYGADRVYAIDVGHDQLDKALLEDDRVVSMENTDIRHVTAATLGGMVDIVTCDVSFMSLEHVIGHIIPLTAGDILLLVKPQFETGRRVKTKKGVLKDKKMHIAILTDKIALLENRSLHLWGAIPSPIKGGEGNIEYFFHCKKTQTDYKCDINALVGDAFSRD